MKKEEDLGKVIVEALGQMLGCQVKVVGTNHYELAEAPVKEFTPDIKYCVKHLAERIHWNEQNLVKYLDNLYTIYPAAVFHVILKELAIVLDEKYPNHIKDSEEIWAFNMLNGEIVRIGDKSRIKNFRNFAAFRTLEDALYAKELLKAPLKDLFGKNGGK